MPTQDERVAARKLIAQDHLDALNSAVALMSTDAAKGLLTQMAALIDLFPAGANKQAVQNFCTIGSQVLTVLNSNKKAVEDAVASFTPK